MRLHPEDMQSENQSQRRKVFGDFAAQTAKSTWCLISALLQDSIWPSSPLTLSPKTKESLELATLDWVSWFSHH